MLLLVFLPEQSLLGFVITFVTTVNCHHSCMSFFHVSHQLLFTPCFQWTCRTLKFGIIFFLFMSFYMRGENSLFGCLKFTLGTTEHRLQIFSVSFHVIVESSLPRDLKLTHVTRQKCNLCHRLHRVISLHGVLVFLDTVRCELGLLPCYKVAITFLTAVRFLLVFFKYMLQQASKTGSFNPTYEAI